jgi:hypothetical protein
MDPNSILLITITVLVAIMTIGVWGILFALARSRTTGNSERTAAVRAIAEECAEAEKVLSSSAAKAMNAHSLKSALLPRIEKIQKMLATNMYLLDVYFVKYTESRLAAFQASFASPEPGAVFPIDKFLSDTKIAAVAAEKQEKPPIPDILDIVPKMAPAAAPKENAFVDNLRARIEAAPVIPPPHETVLVSNDDKREPAEPPEIDLRTGIITVSQEEPKQAKPAIAGKQPAPAKPEAKRTPVVLTKKKPAQPAPAPAPEEAFDFEKVISAKAGQPKGEDLTQGARDTQALHTEKTLRWDKDELARMAGKPESIVVEGAESAVTNHAARTPEAPKHEEAMISGEDIENTLDSFFGLGDK